MKMHKTLLASSLAALMIGQVQAVELSSQTQKFSYTLGVRISKMLHSQGAADLDANAFTAGVMDSLGNKPLAMTTDEMTAAMKANQEALAKKKAEQAAANKTKGEAFLAENAKKSGIKVLPSGLQMETVKEGAGKAPVESDRVVVHYRGTTTDGKQFDSSIDRGQPVTFALNGVIPGFKEAIMQMKVGGKSKAYIPANIGYGERGAGDSIGPNETLIFEIELVDIAPAEPAAAKPAPATK